MSLKKPRTVRGSPRRVGANRLPGTRMRLSPSDAELLGRAAVKDIAAFSELYARYAGVAFSLAYNMMHERQAAEDLVQEAFLEVWVKAGSYREERGSARAWLLSIVHNRGVDRLRALSARRRTLERAKRVVPAAEPGEAFARTWEGYLRRLVNEALRLLPPEQLEVLELAHFCGLTQKEISALLGIPLGTVKSRTRLALKKLKERLAEDGVESL